MEFYILFSLTSVHFFISLLTFHNLSLADKCLILALADKCLILALADKCLILA